VKSNPFSSAKTNPATWWLLGLSLAITASLSANPLVLLTISIASMILVRVCRDQSPWAKSIKFYLQLATAVVVIRILFRIIFNLEVEPADPLFSLPALEVSLGFGSTLQLFGPISSASFMAAVTDGLRLATIILAIGMANSLANPRKLLRVTPGALYEVATAISISINLAPQLITSLNRVRRARGLRGQSKGLKSLPGIVIPVLEDTIDQSMALAASMSARGFGRRGQVSKLRMASTRFAGLAALTSITVGIALLLISPSSQGLDLMLLVLGLVAAVLYIKLSAIGASRTRFRKEPWRLADFTLLAIAVLLLGIAFSGRLV